MLVCPAFLIIMPFVQPVLAILLPAVERLLEQCAPDSCTFLPDEAHLLQLLLSKFNEASAPLLVKDPRCLEVFIRALGTSAKPYPSMPGFQIIALEQVGGRLEKAFCLEIDNWKFWSVKTPHFSFVITYSIINKFVPFYHSICICHSFYMFYDDAWCV